MQLFREQNYGVSAHLMGGTLNVSEEGACLFRDTGGHTIGPSIEFEYTFDNDRLRDATRKKVASVLVHHGKVPPVDGYEAVHIHHEGLPIFLSKETGISNVSLEDLAAVLEGRITNWKPVGGRDVPIAVGIRGDGVFFEAAKFLLGRKNISIAKDAFLANSYEDLAAYGAGRRGALLIGLRGPSARAPGLKEVSVDGWLLATSTSLTYPLCGEVTLLLRENDPKAIALGRQFAEAFTQRIREDGLLEQGRLLVQKLGQALSCNMIAEAL